MTAAQKQQTDKNARPLNAGKSDEMNFSIQRQKSWWLLPSGAAWYYIYQIINNKSKSIII